MRCFEGGGLDSIGFMVCFYFLVTFAPIALACFSTVVIFLHPCSQISAEWSNHILAVLPNLA